MSSLTEVSVPEGSLQGLPSDSEVAKFFAPRPFKAHQRFPTPSNGTGAREFYESLWRERGAKSPMALVWLMEHGCMKESDIAKYSADFAKIKSKA